MRSDGPIVYWEEPVTQRFALGWYPRGPSARFREMRKEEAFESAILKHQTTCYIEFWCTLLSGKTQFCIGTQHSRAYTIRYVPIPFPFLLLAARHLPGLGTDGTFPFRGNDRADGDAGAAPVRSGLDAAGQGQSSADAAAPHR